MRSQRSLLAAALGAFGALGVLAAPAAAQTPRPAAPLAPAGAAGDSTMLSLPDAIARAVGQSQEVRLARAEVDVAESQVTAARAAALPNVDGSIAYTRTFASQFNTGEGFTIPDSLRFEPDTSVSLAERVRYLERRTPGAAIGALGSLFGNLPFGQANAYVASLAGTQTLFAGGKVGAALKIAAQYRESARLGLRESLADIELQTRNAYYRALLAQELERIAAAAVVQAEAFLKQERLRLTAGTASDLEVLRADVSLENLRPQLVQARNAASLATLDLKRLLDIPLTQPVKLTTPLEMPPEEDLAPARVAPERLLGQRAAVLAAERLVAIRAQQVAIARGNFLPSLDLRLAYGRTLFPNTVFGFGGQDWRTDATATFTLRVPIFSGFRTRAELQQARITLDQERLRLSQLRENVQLQYEQALGEQERAAADLSARQRTVTQAQRVYDLTVLRYERGLATQLEVSDARLAALQARTNLAQAIADFYLAGAGVARALGESGVTR